MRLPLTLKSTTVGARLAALVLLERLEVEVAEHAPLEPGRERELEPALDVDRVAEVRHELGHRQTDRLAAEVEGGPLGQLVFPVDALLVALLFERFGPLVAVDVEHLVEREPVAVLERAGGNRPRARRRRGRRGTSIRWARGFSPLM